MQYDALTGDMTSSSQSPASSQDASHPGRILYRDPDSARHAEPLRKTVRVATPQASSLAAEGLTSESSLATIHRLPEYQAQDTLTKDYFDWKDSASPFADVHKGASKISNSKMPYPENLRSALAADRHSILQASDFTSGMLSYCEQCGTPWSEIITELLPSSSGDPNDDPRAKRMTGLRLKHMLDDCETVQERTGFYEIMDKRWGFAAGLRPKDLDTVGGTIELGSTYSDSDDEESDGDDDEKSTATHTTTSAFANPLIPTAPARRSGRLNPAAMQNPPAQGGSQRTSDARKRRGARIVTLPDGSRVISIPVTTAQLDEIEREVEAKQRERNRRRSRNSSGVPPAHGLLGIARPKQDQEHDYTAKSDDDYVPSPQQSQSASAAITGATRPRRRREMGAGDAGGRRELTTSFGGTSSVRSGGVFDSTEHKVDPSRKIKAAAGTKRKRQDSSFDLPPPLAQGLDLMSGLSPSAGAKRFKGKGHSSELSWQALDGATEDEEMQDDYQPHAHALSNSRRLSKPSKTCKNASQDRADGKPAITNVGRNFKRYTGEEKELVGRLHEDYAAKHDGAATPRHLLEKLYNAQRPNNTRDGTALASMVSKNDKLKHLRPKREA